MEISIGFQEPTALPLSKFSLIERAQAAPTHGHRDPNQDDPRSRVAYWFGAAAASFAGQGPEVPRGARTGGVSDGAAVWGTRIER